MCHGFLCEFFFVSVYFLGPSVPLNNPQRNPQRNPQQNSRLNPCKIHAYSAKRRRKIHSAGRGARKTGTRAQKTERRTPITGRRAHTPKPPFYRTALTCPVLPFLGFLNSLVKLGNEKSARSFSDRSFFVDIRAGSRCQNASFSRIWRA